MRRPASSGPGPTTWPVSATVHLSGADDSGDEPPTGSRAECSPGSRHGQTLKAGKGHALGETEKRRRAQLPPSGARRFFLPSKANKSRSTIRNVSLSGHVLPQKSTFFYPKILTGLLIFSTRADERVPA